jgi:hypothetical protein
MAAYREAAPRERKPYQRPSWYHLADREQPLGVAFTEFGTWHGWHLREAVQQLTVDAFLTDEMRRLARPTWWQALGRWAGR